MTRLRRRVWFAALLLAAAGAVSAADEAPAPNGAPDATHPALRLPQPGHVEYPDGSEGFLMPDTLPFGGGEILDYEIQYGVMSVGRARLETREVETHRGRRVLGLMSRARSAKWIDSVYKVRDEISSLLDLDTLTSLRFEKHLREGNYESDLVAEYYQDEGVARYADGSESELMPGSQDILSALFTLRAFPLREGMVLHIPVHDGKKSYPLRVAVVGREQVETPMGRFDCLVLEPTLQSQGLFKSEGRMLIYVSDDSRRLPVKLKARAPVGAFTSELRTYRAGGSLEAPAEDALDEAP
ncbi:MAG: DUF3108 domain-containing protein [Candidatus Krumholzibacteriia bacterium]